MGLGPLPDIGTLSYNGVVFTSLFHSKVEGAPEYARDRRSVKYHKITLTVEGVVFLDDGAMVGIGDSATTDPLMIQLRIRLTQNAKALVYSSKGYGNLAINAPGAAGNHYDVAFGPHPELLSFQPMGGARSAVISWKVTVHIPEGVVSGRQSLDSGVLSLVRSDDLSYDDKGYMTYTVNGDMEIAATVGPGFRPTDFALAYIATYLDPLVPLGFKTGRRDFKFSEDERTCTFSFSWEEMPIGGLPLGCADASGEFSFNNTDKGFQKWQMNLRATYYVRKDLTRNSAYLRFIILYRSRARIRRGVIPSGASWWARVFRGRPAVTPSENANGLILTSFRVSEGLYADSKRTDFEASWTDCSLKLPDCIRQSNIWAPVPDCDYRLWRTGAILPPGAPIPADVSGLLPPAPAGAALVLPGMRQMMGWRSWTAEINRPNADADAIIDVFHRPTPPILSRVLIDRIGDADEKDHPNFRTIAGVPNKPSDLRTYEMLRLPDPETSWASYECEIFTELDPGLAIHKPLPQADDLPDSLATRNLDYQDAAYPKSTDDYNLKSNSTGSDVVQRMSTSTYTICIRGFAVRAGFPIPIPGLVKFAGQTPTPIKPQRVWRSSRASIAGIPIFYAKWELWYQLSVSSNVEKADPYPQDPAARLQPANDNVPVSVLVPDGVFGERVQQEYTQPPQLQNPLQG